MSAEYPGFRSSPRKRGPRVCCSELAVLDSRLRGNEREGTCGLFGFRFKEMLQ
jgi:hypothetical protein